WKSWREEFRSVSMGAIWRKWWRRRSGSNEPLGPEGTSNAELPTPNIEGNLFGVLGWFGAVGGFEFPFPSPRPSPPGRGGNLVARSVLVQATRLNPAFGLAMVLLSAGWHLHLRKIRETRKT